MSQHSTNEDRAVPTWPGRPPDADEDGAVWEGRLIGGLPDVTNIRNVLTGQHDDRYPLTVPHFLNLGVETLAPMISRFVTPTQVAAWGWHGGLEQLASRDEVRTICAARDAVLKAGLDVAIAQLDRWEYHIAGRHGGQTRLFPRKVSPSDCGACARLARGLGLQTSTFGAIAIMCGLVGVPLPGDLPRAILTELQEFFRGLRQRAALARELHKRAVAEPRGLSRFSWSDIDGDR